MLRLRGKLLERITKIFIYYFCIGGALSLILYDAMAIHEDKISSTRYVLLLNLIMLTYGYYQLFIQGVSSLGEKVLLIHMQLCVWIFQGWNRICSKRNSVGTNNQYQQFYFH